MKKTIITIIILLITQAELISQTCTPNPAAQNCETGKGISTNPNNPVNPECTNMVNNFDWRMKHLPGSSTVLERFWVYYDDDQNPTWIQNPFNGPIHADYENLIGNHTSNYQPEDGWELLKVEFGSMGNIGLAEDEKPGANSLGSPRPKLPYMILYNKYTGTMRFFGSLLEPDNTYETVRIELRIPKQSQTSLLSPNNVYDPDLKATNLLSIQGESVQPLDQETDESSIAVFVKYTNNPKVFFWFDLPVAYDPCVCNNKVQLDVSFAFVQTADIDITGTLSGSIKTEKKGNQDYGKMVFGRVLAAGVSAAVAIKTGGAVINVKAFVDLIDIVKDHPSRANNQTEKDNLTALRNYLTCSEKMFSVIKGSYDDVTGKDKKKQIAAGQKILDANTTYLSSLVNGCRSSDNAATTITGSINASGTFTLTDDIDGTPIALALPGSNWTGKQMKSAAYKPSTTWIPAYPTYNERLGTFALLETPKVQLYTFRHIEDPLKIDFSFDLYKFELEDIKYTFNPLLNIDLDKSEIYCRLAIKDEKNKYLGLGRSYLQPDSNKVFYKSSIIYKGVEYFWSNITRAQSLTSTYPLYTPFVPIDQIKNMPVTFIDGGRRSLSGNLPPPEPLISNDSIFIQFKIMMKSHDSNNDEPIEAFYYFTYPVSVINRQISYPTIPHPSQIEQYTQNVKLTDIFLEHKFANNVPRLIFSDKNFTTNQIFTDDETFAYDGIVTISANLSTIPGKKVKIYATMGFELLPGALIGPNIELIYGYPFLKTPQPPQTYEQVAAFCADNNKYKAQNFSNGAILAEQREYIRRKEEHEKLQQLTEAKNEPSIFPNPNSGSFQISFVYELNADAALSVTDVTGRTILSQKLNALTKSSHIELTNAKNGIYFVTITQNGHKSTHKIMVHKE